MGIRLRQLAIVIETPDGPYGTNLTFPNGLTVIRAHNSSGKSTCIMSILYALGLEGMLGPNHRPPFAEIMLESLIDGDRTLEVKKSLVRLEIENDLGQFLTATRAVFTEGVDSDRQRQLIRVAEGPALSCPTNMYDEQDYFVRLRYAAQSEMGFHHRLARFIGYELPLVSGADGKEVPLYLECLLPFFFVDQLSGWRDVKARMPTHLRIPEMAKRATEFILKFDVLQWGVRAQAIAQRETLLRQTWTNRVVLAKGELKGRAVILIGLPDSPDTSWPPQESPSLMYTNGQEWIPLPQTLAQIRQQLETLRQTDMPTSDENDEQLRLLLREADSQLANLRDELVSVLERESLEKSNLRAVDKRIETLAEELREYRDVKTVLDRGGFVEVKTSEGTCPTCRQPLRDTLLPQVGSASPMSLEDNISYIKDEYDTFVKMRAHILTALDARATVLNELRRRETELQQRIREYRRTLVAPAGTTSEARIGEQLRLEHELDRLVAIEVWFVELLAEFATFTTEWVRIQEDRGQLGPDSFSASDRQKLATFGELFRSQLHEYGFRSFDVEEVSLNEATYRPTRHGYEIGLTSASDAVRLIWAYLLAMMEVARKHQTNHIGFVIFDEPKQQNAQDISVEQLLRRASKALENRQQVIVATSEEEERIAPMLRTLECRYYSYPPNERIIVKLSPDDGF